MSKKKKEPSPEAIERFRKAWIRDRDYGGAICPCGAKSIAGGKAASDGLRRGCSGSFVPPVRTSSLLVRSPRC
jgi:hypothetical protein